MKHFRDTSARPTFVDLFCGAGLMSAGFALAGFEPRFAMDLDEAAIQSYNKNVANCGISGDIRDVRTDIKADILLAGPPCQGFSTLGRRDPKDKRNVLCLLVPAWADAIQASVCVVENVPMFTRSSYYLHMVHDFENLGYTVSSFSLQATDYGTPQKRLRSFTVASKIGQIVAPKATHLKPVSCGAVLQNELLECDPMNVAPTPSELALSRFVNIPPLGGKLDLMETRKDLCPPSWFKIPGQATDVWGRIDPDKPSNTIRCNFQNPSKGRYIHPTLNRTLTLREGARLQGIPDTWVLKGSNQQISRQIGNGVPIQMSSSVAMKVAEVFGPQSVGSSSLLSKASMISK